MITRYHIFFSLKTSHTAFTVYRICTCWSWNCYCFDDFCTFWSCQSKSASMSWLFPVESYFLGGFLVPELVIFGRNPNLSVDSTSMSRQNQYLPRGRRVLAVRGQNSCGWFLVYELVIPDRITIYPVEGEKSSWWKQVQDSLLGSIIFEN
jgi:hypothetical protein